MISKALRSTICTTLLALLFGSQPASANYLTSGTVAADCQGYSVTVNATSLDPNISYTADYTIQLMCSVSPSSAAVTGQIPISSSTGVGTGSALWSNLLTLSGTCFATGSATLTQNPGSMVPLTPIPVSFTCKPPPPKCTGSIGDFVWRDLNGNGIQDAGEPGINGVSVRLKDSTGAVVATSTTTTGPAGGDGYYQFAGLCAGSYTVEVVQSTLPPDVTPTLCGNGEPNVDSNCNGSVTLPTDNSSDQTIDFGFVPTPPQCTGSIGDFIWNDLNRNGIQDSGEPGINGVTVRLKNGLGAVVATTTTPSGAGSAGYYQFNGLCGGTYVVEVDQTTLPSNFTPTLCGASGAAVDSNCSGTVTLPTNNSSDQTIDFGYVAPLVGKSFSIGPSSMEGHLTILPGDWISGGYSFKFKTGSHGATSFTVSSVVTVAVTCPKGGGAGGTITIDLGSKAYSVPARNTDWLPTGDANSVLSWMGSAQAPDLCNGFPMDNAKGAVFKATVLQTPPTGSLVDFRFKYRDPNAKGKGNVNCLDTTDPRRAKADVCGASWSATVTDP